MQVVRLVIRGRVGHDEVRSFADQLQTAYDRAVGQGAGVAVLFDRRAMGAPTQQGRAELERWGRDDLPRISGQIVAWADVLTVPRAAALERAGHQVNQPYPQRTFTDVRAAADWLASCSAAAPAGSSSSVASHPHPTPAQEGSA